jgi:predicted XRE-type DNA-binding protein
MLRPMPWIDPVPALKRRLADEILLIMDGWSQSYAASFMHVSQSCVSDLRNGHLDRISLERLVRSLARLNRRVEIHTSGVPRPPIVRPLPHSIVLGDGG